MLKRLWFGYPFTFRQLSDNAIANRWEQIRSKTTPMKWTREFIYRAGLKGKADVIHFYHGGRIYVLLALASKHRPSFLPPEPPHPASYKKLRSLLTKEKLVEPGDLGDWYNVDDDC